jgi:UPF0271 protein
VATIDLNADLGEGDAYDRELLAVVSSCNIACGGHAGDAASMRATVRAAWAHGVAIGAHPSYPDFAGFGRTPAFAAGAALEESLGSQLAALQRAIDEAAEDAVLAHVKPHGALYSDAAADAALATLFVDVVRRRVAGAAVVGPPGSALQKAARDAGVAYIAEAFVDRAYLPDGTLEPRSEPGAVHTDLNTMTSQAVSLAIQHRVTAQNGAVISLAADTLCIHGDTGHAAEAARAVRDVLEANGVTIRAAR